LGSRQDFCQFVSNTISILLERSVMPLLMRKRGFPLKIRIKKAILRRFLLTYQMKKIIEAEIAKDSSGYTGEKMLDYHLRIFNGPEIRIYNNLYFDIGNPFQIDTLIYTHSFFLSIDSKNYDGETNIDHLFNQGIQNNSYGEKKRLPNPLSQAKRHSFLLMELLQKHNYYSIPIEALIVNTNPVGILSADTNLPHLAEKIVNVEMIPQKIEDLQKKYAKPILIPDDFAKIHKMLMNENKPYKLDYEKVYCLSKCHILKGVHCPKCRHLGMKRMGHLWVCPDCGEKSVDAHVQAIHDYFLLVKPTITVSECCDFLGIESRHVARRLLKSMGLPETGSYRFHYYHCPWTYKK
jgi:hypothetical protein